MKEEVSKLEQALHVKETELMNLKNAALECEQKSEDVKRSCLSEVVCDLSTSLFPFSVILQERKFVSTVI